MAIHAFKYPKPLTKPPLPVASLRRWLRGSWALLFSHADDFASYGFEMDRWLMHVEETFAATAIRPLALPSFESSGDADWVTEIGGCRVAIRPSQSSIQRLQPTAEHALSEAVSATPARFVMTLDGSLRLRRTLVYSMNDRLPSPIDLVWMAESLRMDSVRDASETLVARRGLFHRMHALCKKPPSAGSENHTGQGCSVTFLSPSRD